MDKIIKEIDTLAKLHDIKQVVNDKYDIQLYILNYYGFWYEIKKEIFETI